MTNNDLEIFAKTIFGEARGETKQGQIAVANCVLNRFKSKKWFAGKTIAETCLKPWQFSCWNKNDPNREKLLNLHYSQFRKFIPVIKEAITKDVTNGATHYYNPSICIEPAWAKEKKPCAKIGQHLFYKNID